MLCSWWVCLRTVFTLHMTVMKWKRDKDFKWIAIKMKQKEMKVHWEVYFFISVAHSWTFFFFLLLKKKFFMEETTLMIPRCTTAVVIWHYLDFYYLTDLLRKLMLASWSQILIENVLALCVTQCQQWSFSYCNVRTFSSLHVSLYWLEKLCSPAKLLLCKKFLLLQVILMKFLETASVNSLVVWV